MKYYCIKQHDTTDCGAACLATIAKQYGFKAPISRIREIAGTDKQGTNVYGLIKAAESLGFGAKGVKGKPEALLSEFPLPCIANVTVDGRLLHYVVIHKITRDKIIIADPAEGIVHLTFPEFLGQVPGAKYEWTGVLILLTPSFRVRSEDQVQRSGLRRFFSLLYPHKKLLLHIFAASLLYTLLGILGAFYFKVLMDDIVPGELTRTLTTLSIGVILLNVFKILLDAFRSHLLLYLSQKLDISLLLGYYNHVVELPLNFFNTRKVGEIISRFQDAGKVRDAVSGASLTIMIDTVMVIVGGIILYKQNPSMFMVTIVMIIGYIIIVFGFQKGYQRLNKKEMEANAQLTSYLVESLNGIQTVKAFNAEREANLSTEKKFVKLLRSVFDLGRMENIQGALKGSVESIGGIVILWVGALNVIAGNITLGQLVVFNSLLAYFLDPVKNLINLQPMIQTAVVAAERLEEILSLGVEKTEAENRKMVPDDLTGDITFKDIDFRYGTRRLVLENINLEIRQGQTIALVGESGSGKTTLAKLLLHFYSIENGEILINRNNIDDIQIEQLREKIAYVPQETFLFSGTIRENMSLGLDGVSFKDIIEASRMVKASSFINELPLRYDTYLEENGENLSGGQRQRIAIARALLKKPDILIFDEATSNLDVVTEQAINQTIRKYCKDKTTIIIAHRLSTIKNCDQIIVMDKGKIIESGRHEELIKLDGKYAEFVRRQSLDEEDLL